MPRGKSITKLLLDSSQAALFAGIEIHNKPNIPYRYPTATILIVNAWELALKAYVYKVIGRKRIFEKNSEHTISLTKAAVLVRDNINTVKKNKEFQAVFDNIILLNEFRCSNIHYADEKLDPIIFMLISKAVLNYDNFLKEYFNKDITKNDNLIILPVGLKLPFDPVEYLKQKGGKGSNKFVNKVLESIKTLYKEQVHDTIIVGFDLFTASVKKAANADLVAAIDQANADVRLIKAVRITDDEKAPLVRLEPELLPLSYKELQQRIKLNRPDIKFNSIFNDIMKEIKKNNTLCQTRYLDPKIKTGTKKYFYSEKAVDEVIRMYDEGSV